jgi:hypothetical protein
MVPASKGFSARLQRAEAGPLGGEDDEGTKQAPPVLVKKMAESCQLGSAVCGIHANENDSVGREF